MKKLFLHSSPQMMTPTDFDDPRLPLISQQLLDGLAGNLVIRAPLRMNCDHFGHSLAFPSTAIIISELQDVQ